MNVDDVNSIHVNPRVNDYFIQFIDWKYGNPYIGEVKSTRGKINNYLGMTLDYSEKGKFKINIGEYVEQIIHNLSVKLD